MKKIMMISAVMSACMLTAATPEETLRAKLPEIFAKSAEHYKALEKAAASIKGKNVPHGYNRKLNKLDMRDPTWWTSGHFPGSLWYLYDATGDEFFKEKAMAWTKRLEGVKTYKGNHDVGFMINCSYGNARRVLKTDEFDEILKTAADTLCLRYHAKLGLIRSWGKVSDKNEFLVIPDNMMNLELLEVASKLPGGKAFFDEVARSHADKSMQNHFRPDGGCYHVLNYDQREKFLGKVQGIQRGQGLSCITAWSRGQSWGIYGFTMMYRETKDKRYLDFARFLADYAMNHENMPADGVPYWDYGAPGEERDTSAASCMASALLEMATYLPKEEGAKYRAFAVKQLLSLAGPDYFSEGDEVGHFLLKHGVGHKPGASEIDTPLDYGDYYFLEALLRFRECK